MNLRTLGMAPFVAGLVLAVIAGPAKANPMISGSFGLSGTDRLTPPAKQLRSTVSSSLMLLAISLRH
jgi:hypothetical protein